MPLWDTRPVPRSSLERQQKMFASSSLVTSKVGGNNTSLLGRRCVDNDLRAQAVLWSPGHDWLQLQYCYFVRLTIDHQLKPTPLTFI